MMWNGLLPIGSVVLLKESTRRLLIVGQCVSRDENSRIFDYTAVLFPDGFSKPDKMYMFDREQIDKVYYVGYMDEKSKDFLPKMEDTIRKMKAENNQ